MTGKQLVSLARNNLAVADGKEGRQVVRSNTLLISGQVLIAVLWTNLLGLWGLLTIPFTTLIFYGLIGATYNLAYWRGALMENQRQAAQLRQIFDDARHKS